MVRKTAAERTAALKAAQQSSSANTSSSIAIPEKARRLMAARMPGATVHASPPQPTAGSSGKAATVAGKSDKAQIYRNDKGCLQVANPPKSAGYVWQSYKAAYTNKNSNKCLACLTQYLSEHNIQFEVQCDGDSAVHVCRVQFRIELGHFAMTGPIPGIGSERDLWMAYNKAEGSLGCTRCQIDHAMSLPFKSEFAGDLEKVYHDRHCIQRDRFQPPPLPTIPPPQPDPVKSKRRKRKAVVDQAAVGLSEVSKKKKKQRNDEPTPSQSESTSSTRKSRKRRAASTEPAADESEPRAKKEKKRKKLAPLVSEVQLDEPIADEERTETATPVPNADRKLERKRLGKRKSIPDDDDSADFTIPPPPEEAPEFVYEIPPKVRTSKVHWANHVPINFYGTDPNPFIPNTQARELVDPFPPLVDTLSGLDECPRDFGNVKLDETNFHPLPELRPDWRKQAQSVQLWHQQIQAFDVGEQVEMAKTMLEYLNLRHSEAFVGLDPAPLFSTYYIPDEEKYKYRGKHEPLGKLVDIDGVLQPQLPQIECGWPPGLVRPFFTNGTHAAEFYKRGGCFVDIKRGAPERWEAIMGEEIHVLPDIKDKKGRVIGKDVRYLRIDQMEASMPDDVETGERSEHWQAQAFVDQRANSAKLLSNTDPRIRSELNRLERLTDKPETKFQARPKPKQAKRKGHPEFLKLRKPDVTVKGAFVLEPDNSVKFKNNASVKLVGQVAQGFYDIKKMSKADKKAFTNAHLIDEKTLPKCSIPDDLFAECKSGAERCCRFFDWLEEGEEGKENWRLVRFPYYRAAHKDFTAPKQREVRFDQTNKHNLLQFLSDDSRGLKTPASQISAGLGAIFAMHTEDNDLASYNIHYAGDPKFWILIHRSFTPRRRQLEKMLFKNEFEKLCQAYHRHKQMVYDPRWNTAAGIPQSYHEQEDGQVMVIDEETAHMGFSEGSSINTSYNAAYVPWMFYRAPKIIGNPDEVCGKKCAGSASTSGVHPAIKEHVSIPAALTHSYELVRPIRNKFNGYEEHLQQRKIKEAEPYKYPAIYTDMETVCLRCEAQFETMQDRENHKNAHTKSTKKKPKVVAPIEAVADQSADAVPEDTEEQPDESADDEGPDQVAEEQPDESADDDDQDIETGPSTSAAQPAGRRPSRVIRVNKTPRKPVRRFPLKLGGHEKISKKTKKGRSKKKEKETEEDFEDFD